MIQGAMVILTLILIVIGVLPLLAFFFNILRTMLHAIKTGMKAGQESRDDFRWDK